MTNIEKLIERMGLRDIEGAPRDGTRIIAKCESGKSQIVRWERCGFFHHWIMYTDNDGLFSTMKDAIPMKGEAEPTHFMPLPTGKEGEIVRVLLEALKYYDNLHSGDNTALEALAKAEELAGEV